jgi:hypothetical protein
VQKIRYYIIPSPAPSSTPKEAAHKEAPNTKDMDEVGDASKENEDLKDTEAAPLSRSESRGGDWKTQMQDEIMLARSCLLSGDNTKDSMSSVIRLLDQTYQRLVCDENNTVSADTPHNDPSSNGKQHNLSRSASRDQNSAKD